MFEGVKKCLTFIQNSHKDKGFPSLPQYNADPIWDAGKRGVRHTSSLAHAPVHPQAQHLG